MLGRCACIFVHACAVCMHIKANMLQENMYLFMKVTASRTLTGIFGLHMRLRVGGAGAET